MAMNNMSEHSVNDSKAELRSSTANPTLSTLSEYQMRLRA